MVRMEALACRTFSVHNNRNSLGDVYMPAIDSSQRDERIDLRISTDIKRLLVRAASYSGMSLSGFLVSAASDKAKEVVAGQESLVLSPSDWDAFVRALDRVDAPRPKLESAARHYLDGKHRPDA